ncbi:sensor histidine kinase [Actinomadura scrupuli]|uniref:sensor histidine kinase n=1 Tax=Actinomadura scrupuli TaxID=559629 RepID=UPI003D95F9EF
MTTGRVVGYARTMRARAPWRWLTPSVRSRVFDGLLALFVVTVDLGALVQKTDDGISARVVLVGVLVLVRGAALLPRRRHPVAVLAVVVLLDIATHALLPSAADLQSGPALIAMYSCGRYRPVAVGWIAGAAAATAFSLSLLFWPAKNVFSGLIIFALTIALGQYMRVRREMAVRRGVEQAETAVRIERQRIARELHDVVAHHISVMSVLVGAARTTMAIDPAKAAEALLTTERTAREALAEMRQLLAVLRAEGTDDPEPALGARAAEVPALVAAVRATGLRVHLEVAGTVRELPASVDLAVYRIVQEALTNTRKHAAGAQAWVWIRYERAAVAVEVLDDGGSGAAASTAAQPGGGYGLGGMAERVALCGGRLQSGHRPEGGFRVQARIPVPVTAEIVAPAAVESPADHGS